jgi:hypothetical protein
LVLMVGGLCMLPVKPATKAAAAFAQPQGVAHG